jgi:4-oxalocrotonate tautomerase
MPLIQVTMVEGRTLEQKHALIHNLSTAMSDTLEVPLERIRVAIYEVSADEWGVGGQPFSVARPGGVAPPAS